MKANGRKALGRRDPVRKESELCAVFLANGFPATGFLD
jgi:hypothetical protein